MWKAAPGVSLRLFLPNTFITSSLWPHLYVGTTARQGKRGDPNDPCFLIIDCWAGTLGKQQGCFSTIMVSMVRKQSKTTGRSLLLQDAAWFYLLRRRRGGNSEQSSCCGAASLLWSRASLQLSHSTAVLQPVTHTIVPNSWVFKSTLALNEVAGWLILQWV